MSDTSSEAFNPTMRPLLGESNYYTWKAEMIVYLRYLRFHDITLGITPRPATPPASPSSPSSSTRSPKRPRDQLRWDMTSIRACAFIGARVAPSIMAPISYIRTAPELWATLKQHYHHPQPVRLLKSFGTVMSLSLEDGASIAAHLKRFNDAWYDLDMRTEEAPPVGDVKQQSLETALHGLARSELCKAQVMIASLSNDTWEVGWELREKHGAELRSTHVYRRLMDLHEVREARRKRKEEEEARTKRREEEEAAQRECTWCESRGYKSAGHEWKECRKLRAFKRRGNSYTRGSTAW